MEKRRHNERPTQRTVIGFLSWRPQSRSGILPCWLSFVLIQRGAQPTSYKSGKRLSTLQPSYHPVVIENQSINQSIDQLIQVYIYIYIYTHTHHTVGELNICTDVASVAYERVCVCVCVFCKLKLYYTTSDGINEQIVPCFEVRGERVCVCVCGCGCLCMHRATLTKLV